jgi:hypothetical protein
MTTHECIIHQRVQNRRWISKTRRLDKHPVEAINFTAFTSLEKVLQRVNEIAAHRATQAAAAEKDYIITGGFHQVVIQPDFPEFIDDDGRVAHFRPMEDVRKKRCLAASEKTGDHTRWNKRFVCHGLCPPAIDRWHQNDLPETMPGLDQGMGTPHIGKRKPLGNYGRN